MTGSRWAFWELVVGKRDMVSHVEAPREQSNHPQLSTYGSSKYQQYMVSSNIKRSIDWPGCSFGIFLHFSALFCVVLAVLCSQSIDWRTRPLEPLPRLHIYSDLSNVTAPPPPRPSSSLLMHPLSTVGFPASWDQREYH
nr:hypothetical protein CFP56_69843 [Quercus suber]